MKKSLQEKLDHYDEMAKGLNKSLQPMTSKVSLALGGAFLLGLPVSEGAVVQVTVNQNITWGAGNNSFQIDVNGGGNDLRFYGLNSQNQPVFDIRKLGDLNGVNGNATGGYAYPFAQTSNYAFDAAAQWQNDSGTLMNLNYGAPHWDGDLANGQTRFMGFRIADGGCDKYGWVRITKNADRDWTIVDYAWNDACGTAITPSVVLPVELLSFTAKANEKAISLSWETATERNNAGFEVQRSMDGGNFQTIAFVEGKGDTSLEQDYFYEDRELRFNQKYYYRLKQIDYDGQFEYSRILNEKLVSTLEEVSQFYPNPVTTGRALIDYFATSDGELYTEVYNAAGKLMHKQSYAINEGSNRLQFDLGHVGKGIFFVKLRQNGTGIYRKLIIE